MTIEGNNVSKIIDLLEDIKHYLKILTLGTD